MRRIYCILIMLIPLLCLFILDVNAINTGFETNTLSESECEKIKNNIHLSLLEEEPEKKTIQCFDVNADHTIAIGQNASETKTVCIYSHTGEFQYGYAFQCFGDFGVEWNEDILNIYFIRSDVIISVNKQGEIIEVLEVQNTVDNNSYCNALVYSTKRVIGDVEYTLENNDGFFNIFRSSYSQLLKNDAAGEKVILYDSNNSHYAAAIVLSIATALIVILTVAVVKGTRGRFGGHRGRFCVLIV